MIDKDVRQLHKYFDANDSVIKNNQRWRFGNHTQVVIVITLNN